MNEMSKELKPTDVRVGSYVNTDWRTGQMHMVKVTGLVQPYGEWHLHYEGGYSRPLSKCRPIPLTPELMEKCGFMKETYTSELFKSVKGDFNLVWDKDRIFLEHGDNSILIPIKHLHQLQNLFHALTGTELKVGL